MAKECGPSLDKAALDEQISGAMDSVKNSIVGDAAGGIADGIAGLKSSLEGLTDGIAAKVEAAIPEIPKPDLKLQDEMDSLVAGLASGDPGAVLDKLGSMKEKFPGVNVDEMLKEVGVDADKLAIEKKKFDKIKQDALTTARITGQDIASGKDAALDSVSSKLLAVGSGDLSAVADIMGKIPSMTLPGFELSGIKDAICTAVPNVEIVDGKEVKKGVETKIPAEEAEEIEEPSKKNEGSPSKEATNNEKVKEAENIDVIEQSPERKAIMDKWQELFFNDTDAYKKEYREKSTQFNKPRLFGGKKDKDRLRALALLDYVKASRDSHATGRAQENKEAGFKFNEQYIKPRVYTIGQSAIGKESDLLAKLRALEYITLTD